MWEFGEGIEVRYLMCGMRREVEDPAQVALQSLEAAAQSGMPADARIWLAQPPGSSHPACLAVEAAAEQEAAGPYLRRLREGLFCRRRKLDHEEALVEEARAVRGLDPGRFRTALRSDTVRERFDADLERARAVPPEHHAKGADRVKLPSLEFLGVQGEVHGVYGYNDYPAVKDAALAAGARPAQSRPPSIEQALRRFGSMATIEVAAVCRLPRPAASVELWRLASNRRVKPESVLGGELWSVGARS